MPFYDAQPHQFKSADEIGRLKQAILCRGHFGNEHRLGRKCLKRLFKQFLDLALTIVVIDFYLVIAGKLRGVVGEENGRDCSLPSDEGIPPRAGDSSLTAFVSANYIKTVPLTASRLLCSKKMLRPQPFGQDLAPPRLNLAG